MPVAPFPAPQPDALTKAAYQALQQGKSYFSLAHKFVTGQVLNWAMPRDPDPDRNPRPPIAPELLLQIQRKMVDLLDQDWLDAERGVYPAALLFDNAWDDFLRYYPQVCLDMPETWRRIQAKRFQDLPQDINPADYPAYYARNFHYQTDGYLSDRSAQMYDIQVELLFNGSADAMRRRTIAPLKRGLAQLGRADRQLRILDVACGTGRQLRMLRGALPEASLHGVDLSAAYLRKASELLSQGGGMPQLIQANAEQLPYQDGYFQGLSCVFLFHELPGPVRQTVINEAARVLEPGGTIVICDSLQANDSPELRPILDNFQESFHEPFYRNYIEDDMEARLTSAGFGSIVVENHFMSKYWSAQKV
jgi:ubiquinone/menaquinone biosynthesis C-methylase UbiE